MPVPMTLITRGEKAVKLTRADVQPGQLFAYLMKGKPGKNYASVGSNGRMYSINVATGELASAGNRDREVVLTGTWQFSVNKKPSPSVVRECRRSEVRSGEVFHIRGKDTLYAHIGGISRDHQGWLSVPLARTENHAVAKKGSGHASVVATFVLDYVLSA